MKLFKYWAVVLLCAMLAACGGGGGSAGTRVGASDSTTGGTGTGSGSGSDTGGTTGGTTTATPASLEIFASSPQLSSASASSVTFTALAKDASNRSMANQPISFAATSGSLVGAIPMRSTGAAGEPVTGVSLQPGSDASNRNIVVTATSGGLSTTMTIPVVGTSLSVSGNSSVLQGGSANYSVKATDSSGRAIPNARLSITSARSNTLTSTSSFTTDLQGVATFTFRGGVAGADTVTVNGLGASTSVPVAVTSVDFNFLLPAAGTVVPVGGTQAVQVSLFSNGTPQAGTAISFSTTRGTITPSSTVTNGSGLASATVSSTTAGPALITVQANGAQIVLPITFVANNPATLVLQASPTAVLPNSAGSSANQTTLQAVVRDAVGNPVSGKTVNFTAVDDPSSGSISPGTALTDAFGTATAQFIPGSLTTAAGGVLMSASVAGTSVVGTTSLTVSGQALFLALSVGNTISEYDPTVYQRQLSVNVTDANGAAVRNKEVQLSVYPTFFRKGFANYNSVLNQWVPVVNDTCPNEDVNRNGVLDLSPTNEDANHDNLLTPGMPVVIAPATVTTNDVGFATFFIRYGMNYAFWLDLEVTARALVGGTESTSTMRHPLAAADKDVNGSNPPPFRLSPFGLIAGCDNPN